MTDATTQASSPAGTTTHSKHPPATPSYILRGHAHPIHALTFTHANAFLASGDSEGWVVVWSTSTKRAVAVWRAHGGAILKVAEWKSTGLITHGRDHRLRVWQLRGERDLEGLDRRLVVEREGDDGKGGKGREPWLLHELEVGALNFCGFGISSVGDGESDEGKDGKILVAVPNAIDSGGIDFFQLPGGKRVSTIPAEKKIKTGMVMALALFYQTADRRVCAAAGYESGHTCLYKQEASSDESGGSWLWKKMLDAQPHTQPLLSLDVAPTCDVYYTSSADALLARISFPDDGSVGEGVHKTIQKLNTKHAGQQGLSVRNDGKIFATAGWDGRIRVNSAAELEELAVLKWHKDGCYATAFAEVDSVLTEHTSASSPESGEETISRDGTEDNIKLSPEVGAKTILQNGGGTALDAIKRRRDRKARTTHWLAGGGKDGKISLWDIY